MPKFELNETTIFDEVSAAVNTPIGLDLRIDKGTPVTITASGLAGAESVSLWFSQDGGNTYTEYNTGGSQLTLTVNDNVRACYSGVYLGFTKTLTAAPVTVVANVKQKEV